MILNYIIGYRCKYCGQFTLLGCRNEYDEHFCDETCYLDYCKKYNYRPHLEVLKYITK